MLPCFAIRSNAASPLADTKQRLLNLVQERGIQLGMTFLDGTSVRAHQKAAGARRKGALKLNETIVKHLVALVAVMAPRLA